ncbi:MAG: NAD(P)H-hydrate dehydratase [Eubacteriales bacterium]|nr:NAD(P)H-hydrate dehydratase [Eubacteriales bacterium]
MFTLNRKQQVALDHYLVHEAGITIDLLMEAAAHAILRYLIDEVDESKELIFFTGPGNNGGDAYAAARLASGFFKHVTICESRSAREAVGVDSPAMRMRKICKCMNLSFERAERFKPEAQMVLIDGLLGSGFEPERGLSDEWKQVFETLNRGRNMGCQIISIDIPSGVDATTGAVCELAVEADVTLSFVYPKTGVFSYPGRNYAGRIITANLGLPRAVLQRFMQSYDEYFLRVTDEDFIRSLKWARARDGHKGLYGNGFLIAGSVEMPGAALMAAEAALRSGIGRLRAMADEGLAMQYMAKLPELMLRSYDEVGSELCDDVISDLKLSEGCLIGPGLGSNDSLWPLIEAAMIHCRSLILDADALNLISMDMERFRKLSAMRAKTQHMPVVLTPHPGEFARLAPDLSEKTRLEQAESFVRKYPSILVLKGAATVIAFPASGGELRMYLNESGNSGLSKGGSGDVLAGLMLGLLAQRPSDWRAVVAAVYLHGRAADLLMPSLGSRSLLPQDLIACFPELFRRLEDREFIEKEESCND